MSTKISSLNLSADLSPDEGLLKPVCQCTAPAARSPLAWIRFLRQLKRTIAGSQAILIIHRSDGSYPVVAALAAIMGRFWGKRQVLCYRSSDLESELEKGTVRFVPWLKQVDRVVVSSDYHRQLFAKHGIAAEFIPDGVDTERFKPREITDVQPRIVAARSLEPHNNTACLVRAFKFVKQKYPRAELTIIGEGSQRRALEAFVVRERIYGVSYTGRLSGREVAKRFAEADLYLNASSLDNLPRSMLEAMAVGLPVVTTDAGGIASVVRDGVNGLLVPLNDHSTMADRIISLIESPELVCKLSAGARHSVASFAWTKVKEKWDDLGRQLAGVSSGALVRESNTDRL